MNRISINYVLLALFFTLTGARAQSAFTYQGHLNDAGKSATGTYDFQFTLFDASSNGTPIGATVNQTSVGVTNGLFTTDLEFGAAAFDGNPRWLQVGLRPAGSGNPFTTLAQRQRVAPTPYALFAPSAGSVADGSVTSSKLGTGAVTFDKFNTTAAPMPGQLLSFNGTTLTWQNFAGDTWNIAGNSGTSPSVNFLGTKDNVALEIKVNNARAFRLEPGESSPNLIGGYSGNSVAAGVQGGTISGGGAVELTNQVSDDFCFIGGGAFNQAGKVDGATNSAAYATIGGGYANLASDLATTIAGGYLNYASSNSATVAGGYNNFANGPYSFVGGGYANTASGDSAAVSGGYTNTASGLSAFIGGGDENVASADYGTVAGGLENLVDVTYGFIGGGYFNTILDTAGTVGGGQNNASSYYASVGGGYFNNATNDFAVVGGGSDNLATSPFSTIGGGGTNVVTGDFATIPGGRLNAAVGNFSFAAGNRAVANHDGSFVWGDSNNADIESGANNQFIARASGGVKFFSNAGATVGAQLAPNANAWSVISDRNVKKNFRPVDNAEILNQLACLPIQRWNYQWEEDSQTPHIGPMAQDFKAAFYPGRDDKSISTFEFDGVALAAIQRLAQLLLEKESKMAALEKRVAELEEVVKGLATR